jgi:hypothetical protein
MSDDSKACCSCGLHLLLSLGKYERSREREALIPVGSKREIGRASFTRALATAGALRLALRSAAFDLFRKKVVVYSFFRMLKKGPPARVE